MANRPLQKGPEKTILFHSSIPHGKCPAGRAHTPVTASGADADIISPDLFEEPSHGKAYKHGMELLMPLDGEDDLKVLLFIAVIQESIITYLLKTGREHMHHQPADELLRGDTDRLYGRIVAVILGCESDSLFGNTLNPGVGNGDTVCVASQVFQGIAKAVKGLPDIGAPLYVVELVQELPETERVTQLLTGMWENKHPFLKSIVQCRKKLSPELACQDFGREKEMFTAFFQLQILGESCPGDNAVDMRMKIQLLSPGVQDLDDAGSGAEEPGVLGTFQQSMGGTGVHHGIEKFLIGVNQRIKLCGDGKDHMEVRGVNDLGFSCVNPDLLENGLAVGAVTVPAGIVVDGDMAAVLTGGDRASHFRGLTGQDGRGRPELRR